MENEKQMCEITKALALLEESNKAILDIVTNLAGWKPTIDSAVEEVWEEIGELRQQMAQIAKHPVLTMTPSDLLLLISTPPSSQVTSVPHPSGEGEKVCDPTSYKKDTAPGLDGPPRQTSDPGDGFWGLSHPNSAFGHL